MPSRSFKRRTEEKIREQMEEMIELYLEKIELMKGLREHLRGDAKQEMDELISEVRGFKAMVERALKKFEEENRVETVDRLMNRLDETSNRRREIMEAVDRLIEESWERP